MPNAFTGLFLAALVAATATRLWLAQRQIRHVIAHRAAVPASFADSIPLHAHQKAADYTAAKTRLGMIDVLIGAAVLLGFTLGGLTQWLADAWSALFAPGSIAHGTALLLSILLLQGLIGLPTTLYRTFGIESRFGFNRMTLRLFIIDLLKHTAVAIALGVPLLLAVLWLMDKMGEYWWLYVWILWVGYSLVLMMVYPAFIMPLFNMFTSIREGGLAHRIQGLVLFLMVLPEFLFFVQPLTSRYSRKREFEADAYATSHASAAELVRALVKLYQDNAATLTPDPLHSAFYDSHPPAAMRIARLGK